MLRYSNKSEQVVDTTEGGAVTILTGSACLVGLENVEGETAQAGEHAGVGTNAAAVLAEGDVAAVVRGILYAPVRTDCFGRRCRTQGRVRHVESGLDRAAPQPCCGTAGKHPALELDNRLDMRPPLGAGQLVGRVEHAGDARLIAVAAFVVAFVVSVRRRGLRDCLDLLMQGRLVVLDLDDQAGICLRGDLKVFF